MQKTEEKPNKPRPKEIPDFFTDIKWDNFGWIGNKFVCHDYGFLYRFIKYENKMRKIKIFLLICLPYALPKKKMNLKEKIKK